MMLDGYEIEPCKESLLYGFGNNLVSIRGTISLPVVFGSEPCQVGSMIKFYGGWCLILQCDHWAAELREFESNNIHQAYENKVFNPFWGRGSLC